MNIKYVNGKDNGKDNGKKFNETAFIVSLILVAIIGLVAWEQYLCSNPSHGEVHIVKYAGALPVVYDSTERYWKPFSKVTRFPLRVTAETDFTYFRENGACKLIEIKGVFDLPTDKGKLAALHELYQTPNEMKLAIRGIMLYVVRDHLYHNITENSIETIHRGENKTFIDWNTMNDKLKTNGYLRLFGIKVVSLYVTRVEK